MLTLAQRASRWLRGYRKVGPKHTPKISRPGTPERVRAAREIA